MRGYYFNLKSLALLAVVGSVLLFNSARTQAITVGVYSDSGPVPEVLALGALSSISASPIFTTGDLETQLDFPSFNVLYLGSTYGTTVDSLAAKIDSFVSGGGRLVVGQADVASSIDFLPTGFEASVDSASAPTGGFSLTGAGSGHAIFSGLSAADLGTDSEDTILSSSLGGSWTELATTGATDNATGMAIGDYGSGRILLWPDRFDTVGAPSDTLIEQAFDFMVNGSVAASPTLTTTPVTTSVIPFGNVRIGDTSSASSISASNTGDVGSSLTGNFPAAPGEFSPNSTSAFGPLATTDSAVSRDYTYSPTDRTADSDDVIVTSNGGSSTITLTGDGVGPEFEATGHVSNEIDFGTVPVGDMSSIMQLTITNNSPDGDLGNLTDLSLLAGVLGGTDSDQFSVTGYSNQVLETGDSLILDFKFSPTSSGGKTATFTLDTDQAAAFGLDGDDFVFTLTGNMDNPGSGGEVPEPSSLVLASLGIFFALRRRRR